MEKEKPESIIPVPDRLLATPPIVGQVVLGAWILASALAFVVALYRAPEAWMPWIALLVVSGLLVAIGKMFFFRI